MPIFHAIVLFLGFFVISLSLYFTIKEFTVRGKNRPIYFRLFFVISLAAWVMTVFTMINGLSKHFAIPKVSLGEIETFYLLFNFLLWSLFFISIFIVKKSKPYFIGICLALMLIGIGLSFFQFESPYKYFVITAIQNVLICIYCMCYITDQLLYNPDLSFQTQPDSWIVGGLFLYSAVSTPFFVSFEFVKINEMRRIYEITLPLTNLLIIFMHCMIIKSTFVARRNRLGPSLKELEKKRLAEQDEERRRKNAERFGFRVNRT